MPAETRAAGHRRASDQRRKTEIHDEEQEVRQCRCVSFLVEVERPVEDAHGGAVGEGSERRPERGECDETNHHRQGDDQETPWFRQIRY